MSATVRRRLLAHRAEDCLGCGSCTAACQLEHNLPPAAQPIRPLALGPWGTGDALTLTFQPVVCCHCEQPACVLACPTGAMQRQEDGLVFADLTLCIGCQTCAVACPFGIPHLNPAAGKIAKCDGCRERVAQGLWPACVLACPTGALIFAPPARAVLETQTREALRVAATLAQD